jgi:DNA/RNA endonuclease YhcR with UshA esterase domain
MKLSTLIVGAAGAIAVIAVVLLIAGVHFERPIAMQGAALYSPEAEITVNGVVREVQEFSCPVSEGEMGAHLIVKAADSVIQVHLAPGRILRSQKISFAPGDQITVVGSKFRFRGNNDIIAREITRGSENFIFRDHEGKLMVMQ